MNLERNELKVLKSREVVGLLFSMRCIPENNSNNSHNQLPNKSNSHKNNSRSL